jgi:hypothetical protein
MQNDVIKERRATGKWKATGVPHKGWNCVSDPDDLGEDTMTCQMCEVQEIRFAHRMFHPDYPGELLVGCVCAEHMSGDYTGPRTREEAVKRRARSAIRKAEREEQARIAEAKRQEQARINAETQLQRDLANLRARHVHWRNHIWQISGSGNDTTVVDGYRLTVFKKKTGWGGSVKLEGSDKKPDFLQKFYATSESAKLAIFEYLVLLRTGINLRKETNERS